jgi:dTDP-4-dehydrorhamnose reductase
MRTLWITGANGAVGGRLVRLAMNSGTFDRICAFTHSPTERPVDLPSTVTWSVLDIGDADAIQAATAMEPPSVIINPAAMTNVDACETKRDEARQANTNGPRHLAEASKRSGAYLIHISTDYVFPGNTVNPGPYAEDATPDPISYYGQTKQDGDIAVQEVCRNDTPYTIVRTALVVGPGARSNFVTWLVSTLRAGKRVKIVQDQYNTPTLADDLASALIWLGDHPRQGIYHIAGPDRLGRHDWALAIAERFELDINLIDWVTTAELAQPAARPLESGLLCQRYNNAIADGAPRLRGIRQGVLELDW